MLRSLWNGASGMNAQTAKIDSIANNMANANTTGYKKNQANFQDLVYQAINQLGNPVKDSNDIGEIIRAGTGVKIGSNSKIFQQGFLEETNKPLDLAIEGEGFFGIQLPNGEVAYTRDGTFYLNKDGYLCNSEGRVQIQPMNRIPPNYKELSINQQGQIVAILDENSAGEVVGKIQLFDFANTSGLSAAGSNLFTQTEASGQPQVSINGVIRQGFLERSNVDLTEEMTKLIETQRAYELNSRSIKTSEEMWSIANNIKR